MKKIYLLLIGLAFSIGLSAQTLQEARAMFREGNYQQSMPVFEKELKRKPKDASLNYWYGVCVYRLEDKQKAVSYLNIAEKGRIKEASYLLAEAAFERRAFKTCLRHIDQYLLYNTGQHQNEIARLIKLCDQFPKMTQQIEDVLILDSVIVHRDKMLEAIKLHPACGELSAWKGKTAYLNEKGERCYTSDSVAGRGFDIFLYNKMPDNWERAQLDGQLNSAYNEAYPYLLSDGITIYFASDAPGGLGGYDLYISRYNTVSETYFKPTALPFPFNSTANDYAYIVDDVIGRAYLVSDRRQAADSLIVYTFVPNDQRRIVQDKDDDVLLRMAEIISIADTWNGVNVDSIKALKEEHYQTALENYHQEEEQEEAIENASATLLIYDDIFYASPADCRSKEGKAYYEQYLKFCQLRQQLQNTIDNNRRLYSEVEDGNEQKIKIGKRIMQAEWNMLSLEEQIQICLQHLRQAEIPYLNTGL
ncbi:MAG: PD40 domain-containing protein [Bacteroidales bacterium]|nr:PD40 domain-containing protein [Bacteroidales bacterium]